MKTSWRLLTAWGSRSSSMTKEMLIAEAPCEIIWTLTSWTAVNTRWASPGIFLRLSPTQQTIALPPSTFTSLIFRNSVTTSQSFEMSSSVKDTLAEICQLCGLVEGDDLHPPRFRNHARIGRHDSVHIRPDLDVVGVQSRSHEGGGIIRTAPPDRGGDSVARRTDEALQDRNSSRLDGRQQVLPNRGVGEVEQRCGAREVVVGDDALPRVHQLGCNAACTENLRENPGREPLPDAGNGIHASRRQLPKYSQPFEEGSELLEVCA